MCVFGTRPDAVKMAPVVRALRRDPESFQPQVVVTGQHREQLEQVMRAFDLQADRDLAIMRHGQTLAEISVRALEGLDKAIGDMQPDVLLSQGDTTTTFVGALAAFYRKVPYGHVEAGLRTDNMYNPFPEEMNRRLTACIASYHFAPTPMARENLLRENIPAERIWVTGNTGIDALLYIAQQDVVVDDPQLAAVLQAPLRTVLITAHRRENWGAPLRSICRAVRRLAQAHPDCQFVYAMHKNPVVRETAVSQLGDVPQVHLIEPPDYAPFVKLMRKSHLILTDSGGVQEEAPSLGVPVLVLRSTTERPEGVEAGVAKLIGCDEERIVEEAGLLLNSGEAHHRMAQITNPYGDGSAAEQIVRVLRERVVKQ
jgi:UDP-N-acetylglucosamine 2-epimerase